jgi:hypothetical protein
MLTETDLNAPAHLAYRPAGGGAAGGAIDWEGAQSFGSLREALHWSMSAEAPAGQAAFIRTASGTVLEPETLETLWSSLQGP